MRHIVVYKIIMVIGFLTWITTVAAQKPAIDLISSHHQYRHPESIIDTCFATRSVKSDSIYTHATPLPEQEMKKEQVKKKRRQIGPSLDTLFQKEEPRNTRADKSKAKTSMYNRHFKLLKIFIFIFALK